MLTCYFDEAGGIKDSFTVVCGFGSTAAKWERFEIDWKLFLASYKVDYFHMLEFSQSTGQFKKWKGATAIRERFMREATEIIRNTVDVGVAYFVTHKDFTAIDKTFQLTEMLSSP